MRFRAEKAHTVPDRFRPSRRSRSGPMPGWTPVRRRGAAQTDVEVWLETLAYTAVLRFAVDVALRLTDEGESTYVDMRSASHFGRRDFGENAARIGAFMADLDAAMLARAGG
ncbi:MAG: DUF1499 domain-containing protein [Phyllobacteriaceae bacterium]|nr:DUF1499 domain-containing protein [Phyllobacteriaceae bacterium]